MYSSLYLFGLLGSIRDRRGVIMRCASDITLPHNPLCTGCQPSTRFQAAGWWLSSCPSRWVLRRCRAWVFLLSYRHLTFPLFYFVGYGLESSAFLGFSLCFRLTGSLSHLLHQSLKHLVGRVLKACQFVRVDAHNLLTFGDYGAKLRQIPQSSKAFWGK